MDIHQLKQRIDTLGKKLVTLRKETPNPSNHRINTGTALALRHYRHNSP